MSRFTSEGIVKKTTASNIRAQKFLTFDIDGRLFGVPVGDVLQITGVKGITPLPNFPAYTKGVLNLRGAIVPVIDVRIRFGMEESLCNERSCIIITRIENFLIGFLVDSVSEVLSIPNEQISPPPTVSNDFSNAFLSGVGQIKDNVVMLISMTKILSEEEFGRVKHSSSERKEFLSESKSGSLQAAKKKDKHNHK